MAVNGCLPARDGIVSGYCRPDQSNKKKQIPCAGRGGPLVGWVERTRIGAERPDPDAKPITPLGMGFTAAV
jgi:hypothetical protein